MTREELKEELNAYHAYEAVIAALTEEQEHLFRQRLGIKSSWNIDGMPKGGEKGGFEAIIDQLLLLEAEIARRIEEKKGQLWRIEELLSYARPVERCVLELYYLHKKPMWLVGRELSYDRSWCWKLHNDGLLAILKRVDATRR